MNGEIGSIGNKVWDPIGIEGAPPTCPVSAKQQLASQGQVDFAAERRGENEGRTC